MASGSQNLTTYIAKRIIGDSTNADWTGALLHSGTGGKTSAMDTWIFADDYGSASSTYGILHRQSDDKIVFIGASTDRFWNDLNTGNTYIGGNLNTGSRLTVRAQDTTHEGGEIVLSPATNSFSTVHIDAYDNMFRLHDGTNERFKVSVSTGNVTVNGNLGIGIDYAYGVSGNSYKLYVKGTSNFSDTIFFHKDGSLQIFTQTNGQSYTGGNTENVCIQTSFDDYDYTYSNFSTYLNRVNLLLQPKGGQVYIGLDLTSLGNTNYKLYVNGNTYFNGNTTHNGIDYFANGTTYYINNSGDSRLRYEYANAYTGYDSASFISSVAGSPWPYIRFDTRAGGSTYVTTASTSWNELYTQVPARRASDNYYYKARFFFRSYSKTANTTTRLNYYEDYYLPEVNDGRTGNVGYDIRTSKSSAYNVDTATRINGNLAAATSNVSRNIWVSSTASADGIPNYVPGFYITGQTGNLYVPGAIVTKANVHMNYNGTDWIAVQNFANGNVGLNACGGSLWLGYQNTGGIWMQKNTNSSSNSLGHGIFFADDSEGGNIRIYSGNCGTYGSYYWEIDAYNGNLRFYNVNSAGTYKGEVYIRKDNVVLFGAAWNDYAEMRNVPEANDYGQEGQQSKLAGRCVQEVGDDTMIMTNDRLQPGCKIVSDTFGFNIGETEECKTPIAVSGRVLAYLYEGREAAKSHIGRPVCSGPNGTVSIMTEDEEKAYPSRIVGIISAVPDYKYWGTGNVEVNERIWIYVR